MRQCVKFFIKMNKNSRKSLAIFIFFVYICNCYTWPIGLTVYLLL